MESDKIYLASSAAKPEGYDLLRTLALAEENGFNGVQLYLNEKFLDAPYRKKLAEGVNRRGTEVILHLPDVLGERYRPALVDFKDSTDLPEYRALIHFQPDMEIPKIAGYRIGLENADFGPDEEYYKKWNEGILNSGSFKVFDIPRVFGDSSNINPAFEARLIEANLSSMGKSDVLHLIDQKEYGPEKRLWCDLGEGLLGNYLGEISNLPGIVVLEYEDIGSCVRSRDNLVKTSKWHK